MLISCTLYQHASIVNFGKVSLSLESKKSHEIIRYKPSWIASSGEWEYGMSTKPCYLTEMTLIELYMEGLCWANAKKMPQSV